MSQLLFQKTAGFCGSQRELPRSRRWHIGRPDARRPTADDVARIVMIAMMTMTMIVAAVVAGEMRTVLMAIPFKT